MALLQATKDRYRNKGAYIVLGPPDFDTPVFHSFEAVFPRPQVKDPTKAVIPEKEENHLYYFIIEMFCYVLFTL